MGTEPCAQAFPSRRARRVLPQGLAFAGAALALAAYFLAAGAPTPLFTLYQREWGFPEWLLTVAFSVYAVALLAALLVVGKLSDHIGRRPVIVASLVLELVGMLVFLAAPSIGWVIVARVIQGVATGAATSALTASIVESAPERSRRFGGLMTAIAPTAGLGLGALFGGAAVQFSANAPALVFGVLAALMVLGVAAAWFSAETVSPRAGVLGSLVPTFSVPPVARGAFVAVAPVIVSSWMFGALFLGLGPTIVHSLFGIESGFLQGTIVFLEPALAAVAGLVLGRLSGRRAVVLGGTAVLLGSVLVLAALFEDALWPLLLGGAIGGFGFGASFSGALRALGPLAEAHERAGMFAALYLVSYLAFGVPVAVAGFVIGTVGLTPVALVYTGVVLVVSAVALLAEPSRR